ncbi:hypothetical protein PTTG_27771 [Puccinia triticina 1-1 BBBD Race 1]|uniref:Uncharacterized protein n=1 Tax=Puccinia triticina (isolate 1-1 / race 1 (BBBD)) TaxID=630390 RepID=A0A180GHB1_PUCT1|nr:hypothetical protein PTTG_27771 [Puccinia triticina 1-1 BBBD Race 1]
MNTFKSKPGQEGLVKEFSVLRKDLSTFNQQNKEYFEIKLAAEKDGLTKYGNQQCIQGNAAFRIKIDKLESCCRLMQSSTRGRLFQLTGKYLEIETLRLPAPAKPSLMRQVVRKVYKGKKSSKAHESKGKGSTSSIRELITEEQRMEDRSNEFLAASSLEPEGKLTGNTRDVGMDMDPGVTSGWLKTLNELLHEIMSNDTAGKFLDKEMNSAESFECFYLQQFVFRTVELMYKYGIISHEATAQFLQDRDTRKLAVLNNYATGAGFVSTAYRFYPGCSPDFRYSNEFVALLSMNSGL